MKIIQSFKLIFVLITLFSLSQFISPSKVKAQLSDSKRYKASIVEIKDCEDEEDCKIFVLKILDGDKKELLVDSRIRNATQNLLQNNYLKPGFRVFVDEFNYEDGPTYIINGPIRDLPLFLLITLFLIITIAVGRVQGIGSLVGLFISVATLYGLVTTQIIDGKNPILIGYIGGLIILVSSIFLSHGINKKSFIALTSSFIGLILVSVLTMIFIRMLQLNGFGDDNALNLLAQTGKNLDMRGILFASIIIGGIGVLDDITINQVSALQQIYLTDKKQTWKELFRKAMVVGKDHISSLVNTLFIAYASASLPLVMILQATNSSFYEIVNSDQFAEEIARTLLGSIGLILVVPISSLIAAYYITKSKVEDLNKADKHEHHH